MVILAPLASRWGYTLVHMEYINVMLVVTVLSSGCSSYQVSLSLLSIDGQGFRRLARASGSLGRH